MSGNEVIINSSGPLQPGFLSGPDLEIFDVGLVHKHNFTTTQILSLADALSADNFPEMWDGTPPDLQGHETLAGN